MKTKYLIIAVIIVVVLWFLYKYKKGDIKIDTKQPTTREDLIEAIKRKNSELFERLASDMNKSVEDLDYSYFDDKTTSDLKYLLSLDKESLAREIFTLE